MQIYTFAAEKSNLILMSKQIRLKKGLNIHLLGDADKVYASIKPTQKYVLKPSDFHGLTPKLTKSLSSEFKLMIAEESSSSILWHRTVLIWALKVSFL